MVNVFRFFLPVLLLVNILACSQSPSYRDSVSFKENDTEWTATLHRAWYHINPSRLLVEVEYANNGGASFSVKPENLAITNGKQTWRAGGRRPYIPLLKPGDTFKIRVAFDNVTVTDEKLFFKPFHNLVHADPQFLLKEKGEDPLPGEHNNANWHVPH